VADHYRIIFIKYRQAMMLTISTKAFYFFIILSASILMTIGIADFKERGMPECIGRNPNSATEVIIYKF
jgi:hypothetical protein